MSRGKKRDWVLEPMTYRVGEAGPWKTSEKVKLNMRIEPSLRQVVNEQAAHHNVDSARYIYLLILREWERHREGKPTPEKKIRDCAWNDEIRSVRTNVVMDDFIRDLLRAWAEKNGLSLADYVRALLIPPAKQFLRARKKKAEAAKGSGLYKKGRKRFSETPYLTAVVPYQHEGIAKMVKQAADMEGRSVLQYHRKLVFLDLAEKFGTEFVRAFDELSAVERTRRWERIKPARRKNRK